MAAELWAAELLAGAPLPGKNCSTHSCHSSMDPASVVDPSSPSQSSCAPNLPSVPVAVASSSIAAPSSASQ